MTALHPYTLDRVRMRAHRATWDEMDLPTRARTMAATIAILTDLDQPFTIAAIGRWHGWLSDLLEGVKLELRHRYPRNPVFDSMSRAELANIAYPALMEWAASPSRVDARHIEALVYWWAMASVREASPYNRKAA